MRFSQLSFVAFLAAQVSAVEWWQLSVGTDGTCVDSGTSNIRYYVDWAVDECMTVSDIHSCTQRLPNGNFNQCALETAPFVPTSVALTTDFDAVKCEFFKGNKCEGTVTLTVEGGGGDAQQGPCVDTVDGILSGSVRCSLL